MKLYFGSNMEVVHSSGSHERQFHVRVRVDATGDHQFIGGINDSHSFWNLKIQSNLNYFPIFDVNVADHGTVLVHNFASFNQDAAGLFHSCSAQLRVLGQRKDTICANWTDLCALTLIRLCAVEPRSWAKEATQVNSKVHMRYQRTETPQVSNPKRFGLPNNDLH